MTHEWHDGQPIYRQLRDHIVSMLLDDVLKEGDPLPSVRTVAAEYPPAGNLGATRKG